MTTSPERVPRKREETVRRLLEAAHTVFRERGVVNATVGDITSLAGYTRGAFYSAFGDMDGLYFAMYEQHAATIIRDVETGLARLRERSEAGPITIEEGARIVLEALPLDSDWHAVNSGFISLAARRPDALKVLTGHQQALRARLEPLLLILIHSANRRAVVPPDVLVRVVTAVHAGALSQALVDDPDGTIRDAAIEAVLLGLSEPASEVPAQHDP